VLRKVIKEILFFCFYYLYTPIRNTIKKLSKNNFATIIMYHRINDLDDNTMTVDTAMFSRQIEFLKNKYRVISLNQLLKEILEHEKIRSKSVVITFDDGYKDNFTNAFPILKRYNIPAIFFVTTSFIGTDRKFPWDENSKVKFKNMTWEDLKNLLAQGYEIGSHTVNHIDFGKCAYDEACFEIKQSRKDLEKHLEVKVKYFSVPFGKKQNLKNEFKYLMRDSGYKCCLTGYGGLNYASTDVFELKRISIPRTTSLLCFKAYLEGFKRHPQ